MTDKELIKEEIERIIEKETPISKGSDYYHGAKESMEKLRQFIDSLPEEHNEDFEEAANQHSKKVFHGLLVEDNIAAFKAGAEWQKQQDEKLFKDDSWNYIEENYPNISQEEKLRLYDVSIKSRLTGANTIKQKMKETLQTEYEK